MRHFKVIAAIDESAPHEWTLESRTEFPAIELARNAYAFPEVTGASVTDLATGAIVWERHKSRPMRAGRLIASSRDADT